MNLNIFNNTKLSIGILGGSFNPPHFGHLEISKHLIKKLKLDYIWWLVTPQNPLKNNQDLMSFDQRMSACQELTKFNNRIIISDLENELHNSKTYNTISYILNHFPGNNFTFIIGADNLAQFSYWYRWQDIWQKIKIAVYNRQNYKYKALHSKAAIKFAKFRITPYDNFKEKSPPAWCMINDKLINISSTQLRQTLLHDKKN
jgi:nicotinate-nucleotide adenylyltransferase